MTIIQKCFVFHAMTMFDKPRGHAAHGVLCILVLPIFGGITATLVCCEKGKTPQKELWYAMNFAVLG